jgi:hypothetical protein
MPVSGGGLAALLVADSEVQVGLGMAGMDRQGLLAVAFC